ncbi:MAG: preprotein translocase subunit SecG [Rhodobacteraceae bacterium]|nr:preprotein translocase subunit SecG [Paracoccaceae bacterium]MCY4195577.1 preprotein translocase subunit SecG [Paracoccaceae bacterium]
MSNVVLVIQLILALVLIAIVLLQRSEGGGLGIGGGGGVMTGRQAATALGKATWVLAVAFLSVSLALTIITAREQAGDSVIERVGDSLPGTADSADPLAGEELLPPILPDAPAAPPKAE